MILVDYQLRTLQHQVTPHFMFNVINHIPFFFCNFASKIYR